MKKQSNQPRTPEEFDEYFEENDIADLLETRAKRINIDMPPSVLMRLDLKARELGLTRQALVKYWIAERLNLISAREGSAKP